MTSPNPNTPPAASPMKKYGPLIGIVVVLLLIGGAIVIAGRGGSSDSASTTGTAGGGGATATNPSDAALTWDQAKAQGKEGSTQWVDNCDPQTGRIKMPSIFAPPCVQKVADNGGATSPGVTADKITIVNYIPPDNNDILSRFTAQLDSKEDTRETQMKFAEMFDGLYETYGRKVEIIQFDASGAPQDPTAATADAINVAEKYKPFASLGGPALTPAYAEELSRRGILCLGCGLALPDKFYQDHAPYIWGYQPTPEEFLVNLGDYITKRVAGKKAEFGGDEVKNQERRFGVVHFEQDPPVFTDLAGDVAECGQKRGYETAETQTYLFDIGSMPDRATTIIAKMKAAGVTSIIFLGDPIMPIYLTQAATAQNYFPEWIVTGTVLTDTTVLGRFYDPQQWKHAFGLSNLPARTAKELGESWRLHEWYFGTTPKAANTQAIVYQPVSLIHLGIHMAGPNLTPNTFKQGLFNYPKTGGGPTTPHVSFGDHGFFKMLDKNDTTCQGEVPRTDYLGSDDVTEIWWDATATGPDEQGKTDKPGMWRYANNGKRYLPGTMPATPPDAFKMENTVTILDTIPKEDVPPEYPSPAKP